MKNKRATQLSLFQSAAREHEAHSSPARRETSRSSKYHDGVYCRYCFHQRKHCICSQP